MKEVHEERYIGDIISSDLKNRKNIKARTSRSVGNMINIMNILNEVSLGQYHFTIGKLLRETIFLSSMLVSSETWINVTTDIEELESCDRILARQIMGTAKSTPIPAIYLELSWIPIRFIIQ